MSDRIYLSPPDVGTLERDLLLEAFDSNWIAPLGPHVDAFETELAQKIGVRSAAALSSGTAALHLALLLSGVGPGDEVYCSTLTFVATANAITYCGAIPVFIDSDRQSWNLDPDLLEASLEEANLRGMLPRAVVVVDLYGQTADYDRIERACERYEIPLIEDAAEALGARYRSRAAGGMGKMGVFSFNGNKIITTSGGGMLVSNTTELIERARFLASQARQPAPHYQHSEIGFNYRMSNLLAAVGRGQLRSLEEKVQKRRSNFEAYSKLLGEMPGVEFMPEPAWSRSTRWLTCATIDPRLFGATNHQIRERLAEHNIESRPLWKPMHLQPAYAEARIIGGEVSESLFRDGICLPSGSGLSSNDVQRVARIVAETLRR